MIGGMKKTVSRLALAAAAVGMSTSAMAADLGGSCCADLEERIAELEATTARKGNRVMSLRISGAVAARVVYHNADPTFNYRSEKITIEDYDDGGDLRFSGSANVTSDVSMGFRMSFDPNDNGVVSVDDLYLYVDSKRLGRVLMGRVDSAFDGINAISLASREDVALDDAGFDLYYGGGGGGLGTAQVGVGDIYENGFINIGDIDGNDAEGGTIRYISPTIAGFVFSASYSNDDDEAATSPNNTGTPSVGTAGHLDNDEIWAVALRYAGEFNGIRVAAGIGYEEEQDEQIGSFDRQSITGSMSIMHAPSGLFFNFAAGQQDDEIDGTTASRELTAYHFALGVERKFIALGKTSMYGHVNFAEFDWANTTASNTTTTGSREAVEWGLGMVQQIDAASSAWALQFIHKECVATAAETAAGACSDDASMIYSGLTVKF